MTPFPSADIEMNVEDDGSYAIEHDDNILVSEEDHCSMLSESTTVSSHGHKAGQRYDNDESDTPEKLVRRENRAIRISRIGAILILVVATVTTSLLIHGFMSKSEEEAFNSNFKMVSGKIVESMKADAALKFWMARSLANTVTLALDKGASTATNLTLPPTIWERITQEARFTGNGNLVAWSPLLLTESARQDFEAFSATQEFTIGANPVCFVCGAELRGYSNPGDMVELTGFGSYPCSQIENSGRLGIIPEENCEAISLASSASCRCADLPNDSVVVDNKMVVPAEIFQVDENSGNVVTVPSESGPYSPLWQTTVLEINQMPLMYDQMTDPVRARAIRNMKDTLMPVVSEIFKREGPYYEKYGAYLGETSSILYYPVFDPSDELLIGSITIEMLWKTFMTGVFPPNSEYVDVVVETSCGQSYTYKIDPSANSFVLMHESDSHDTNFDDMMQMTTFSEYEEIVNFAAPRNKNQTELEYCRYRYIVYATEELKDEFTTSKPIVYALITAGIFLFTSIVFVFYDVMVNVRQAKVMASAKRTNAIVSTLFPQNVRDRLFAENSEGKKTGLGSLLPSKLKMQSFLDDEAQDSLLTSEPIADLFPHATIMFLDIAGFTAWSSEREPTQVFKLLETLYQAFDQVAQTMGVFKVETIGDSYVAVSGVPTKRDNHAVVMAAFANHCLKRMANLTRQLEVHLGPETGDLKARVGLHSGPVTAGVLRGEKARFQLFGDTVNTASRMESSGKPGHIHCSKETRDLLVAAGKAAWVNPRENQVQVKGKGTLQTFWVDPRGRISTTGSVASSSASQGSFDCEDKENGLSSSALRLVEWNVEVLHSLLENIVQNREPSQSAPSLKKLAVLEHEVASGVQEKIVIDELTQILDMPEFNESMVKRKENPTMDPLVKQQLHEFVTIIANLYRNNVPFHNFSHASHVIMSAGKLMKRIVQPEGIDYELHELTDGKSREVEIARQIYKATYGISADPLMQFAVVFSALIHDVDHTGLTNAELVKMGAPVSAVYRCKSIAEQNSVTLAWEVLMDDCFKELRACIYTNKVELEKFRQLLVNAVLATDIADKELKTLRESRWDDAFSESGPISCQLDMNRRATIVFEYIIQASDIAHTMQHWLTYQKFNARLFEERYLAWVKGHAGEKDPSMGWYGGEIWFFDNYIIPLARKLDKCGVFGVSYHEYLNYALANKKEWERKGKEIVAEMLAKCQEKYGTEIQSN